jgi:hypothetical protein
MYRGINYLKWVTSLEIIKNEKGYLFKDSYIILAWWWNHFSQLFNVHGVVMSGRQKYVL